MVCPVSMFPVPRDPPPPPNYSRGDGGDEAFGLLLLVLAGLAIWRFGLWWGIGVVVVGFVVTVFVGAVNLAGGRKPARSRGPFLAQLHAVVSSLLGGVLGFGVASVIVPGASGTVAGIGAAAAAMTLLDELVGRLLDMDWSGAVGSWCLVMIFWLPLSVPVAALIAPDYRVSGVVANLATMLLVFVAGLIAWRASPWRWRWGRPSTT